jgi:cyclase
LRSLPGGAAGDEKGGREVKNWKYTKGLHDLGGGIYAYLLPDGSWGWNNAGLVVDGDDSLLIDTLFDLDLTREMLAAMAGAEEAAKRIKKVVITHGNGDHFYGIELVRAAEIICTKACAEEMTRTPPQMLAQLKAAAPGMGDLGAFFLQCFGPFKFEGIDPIPPNRTFEGRLDIKVGRKEVRLIQVGPAHTEGDMLVYIPENRVLFAGDILFIGGTPLMWVGPVGNWIRACDLILEMDVETIVPGHGSITDKKGVEAVKGYWEYLAAEARKRYERGMSVDEAVADIDMSRYSSWTDGERIVVNVQTLYKEFKGDTSPANPVELFGGMAKLGLKGKAT